MTMITGPTPTHHPRCWFVPVLLLASYGGHMVALREAKVEGGKGKGYPDREEEEAVGMAWVEAREVLAVSHAGHDDIATSQGGGGGGGDGAGNGGGTMNQGGGAPVSCKCHQLGRYCHPVSPPILDARRSHPRSSTSPSSGPCTYLRTAPPRRLSYPLSSASPLVACTLHWCLMVTKILFRGALMQW